MEHRVLGRTGLDVGVLGFGGAEIGFRHVDPSVVERLLSQALDDGLNLIDTAPCYGNSEELIGGAVASRRSEFVLMTKCGHAAGLDTPDWDPRTLRSTIDRSLKLLRTDHVDVLHLHSCSHEILEQGDLIAVMQEARDAGKTRFIGYSGDADAAECAVRLGVFDTLMTSLSVVDQEAIERTLPLARERGMGVIVKRPIGNAVWRFDARPEDEYVLPYWERLQALGYPWVKGAPEVVASTALRFTLGVPGVTSAIVGSTRPGRWRENAALLEAGPLSVTEVEAICARWRQVAADDWVGQV